MVLKSKMIEWIKHLKKKKKKKKTQKQKQNV